MSLNEKRGALLFAWFNFLFPHFLHRLRQKIQDALQGNEIDSVIDPIIFSRHYKIGSLEGNMIFEEVGYLPKEVMLELTLKAFGFEIDMLEVGILSLF